MRVGMNGLHAVFRRRGIERRALARMAALQGDPAVVPPTGEHDHVRQAVAALPRRQRTALVLLYYLDLPVSETAAVMGCAEGTVKSLTSKAIDRLGHVLSPDEERGVRP